MSVTLVWWDSSVEHEKRDASMEDIMSEVGQLNGQDRSLVTLYSGGSHLSVGGDASGGLVLYVALDEASFYQLSDGSEQTEPVHVVAGGQAAPYERRLVLGLPLVELAILGFFEGQSISRSLSWLRS